MLGDDEKLAEVTFSGRGYESWIIRVPADADEEWIRNHVHECEFVECREWDIERENLDEIDVEVNPPMNQLTIVEVPDGQT